MSYGTIEKYLAAWRHGNISLRVEDQRKANHAFHAGLPTDGRRIAYYVARLARLGLV